MEKFLELINMNKLNMFIFVLSLIILKYGVLGFVLSKKFENNIAKEKIDSIFTFTVLLAIFLINRNRNIAISNGNILINIVYVFIAVILYYGVNIFFGEKFSASKSKNQEQIENLSKDLPFWLALISTGFLAPIFEEVIFRFYIQDLIFQNTILAIFLTSILFSLMHMVAGFSIAGFLTYMAASIVVSILYWLSGGLLFSSIMHVIVNSLAVVFMYFGDKIKEKYKKDTE